MIKGIWNKGTSRIHVIHVVNTDVYYYSQRYPVKVLQGGEKDKISDICKCSYIISGFFLLYIPWIV